MYFKVLFIVLVSLISEITPGFIRCIPERGNSKNDHEIDVDGGQIKSKTYRQRTFIRNPNFNTANIKFDKLAENMYIKELPLPHPGAKGGSSRGCDNFEIVE